MFKSAPNKQRDSQNYVWTEINPAIERDQSGEPTAVIMSIRDITSRKDAEAYRASLASIVETSADAIISKTLDGVITSWNPAAERLFGYAASEAIGKPVTMLIPSDRQDEERQILTQISGGEHLDQLETMRVRKDGSHVAVSLTLSPVKDDAGQIIGVSKVARDITLTKLVLAQLDEARATAERAAAVKSEFLANMSHEIRTPLTAILGFTHLLKERSDLDASARTQISRVVGASQALLAIVNDILDFSKLEAGEAKIEPRATALSSMLRDTLLMFSPMADAKGLDLHFAVEGSLPDGVSIDPDKTRQILTNLIGNAVKFTDAGAVRLVAAYDRAAERLDVRIEDDGAGMTAEQLAALFQRFTQVDASSTRRHGGTGLGLAICKGLAEAMGGEIGVRSVVGKGTTFYFHIPAPFVELNETRPESACSSEPPLEDVRVLVIDDNPSNRELARLILEQFGAIVTDAADGFAGLEAAKAEPVDIILLDLRMPQLNGPEVLSRLRSQDGPNQDVPILAFTADTDLDRLGDDHGFNGLVRKPLAPAELMNGILRAINGDASDLMTTGDDYAAA